MHKSRLTLFIIFFACFAVAEQVPHPNASKGLKKIDSDGVYHYEPVRYSSSEQTSTIRIGNIQAPAIEAADGTTYTGMYGGGRPTYLMYDYEWQPLTRFGKLGLQVGGGFFTATGSGRFVNADGSSGGEAREKYSFYALPVSAGVVYRLEFLSKQWIAPYVSAGGTYFILGENRDDSKAPHFVGTPAAWGAGGAMFNITALDRDLSFSLDSEYGIGNLWLTAEARVIKSSNQDLDMGGTLVSVGISTDY